MVCYEHKLILSWLCDVNGITSISYSELDLHCYHCSGVNFRITPTRATANAKGVLYWK